MSDWRGRIVTDKKIGIKHVELKKTYKQDTLNAFSQILILVALDGWRFKDETPEGEMKYNRIQNATKGLNVRRSMNGPMAATFEQFDEINQAIQEAKLVLENGGKCPN